MPKDREIVHLFNLQRGKLGDAPPERVCHTAWQQLPQHVAPGERCLAWPSRGLAGRKLAWFAWMWNLLGFKL